MNPVEIAQRLEQIESDLALRMPLLEDAARKWFIAKRDQEHAHARAYMSAEGPAHQRKAEADLETALIGKEEEAEYEALRAVVRTLETRASIGQTLARVNGNGRGA